MPEPTHDEKLHKWFLAHASETVHHPTRIEVDLWWDAGCTDVVPPVWGGQNRPAEEVEEDGRVVGVLLCWAFFFVSGLLVGVAL